MNSKKRNGQTIYHDENGDEYTLDSDGNRQVPMTSKKLPRKEEGGWEWYDDSQGHCSFCGKLTCNGRCFK